LPLNADGLARLLPIDFVQAPTARRPRKVADAAQDAQQQAAYRQQQRQQNINRQALRRVEHLHAQLQTEQPGRRLWLVGDGRFTNGTFLRGLSGEVTFIGRTRGDAKLCAVPAADAPHPRGGRPRRYGVALPTPEALRQDDGAPWQTVRAYAVGRTHEFRIKTVGPLRWRCAGDRNLSLLVIAPLGYRLHAGGKLLYRRPAYLLCTDPTLAPAQIVQAYLWRWDIEVNLRDEKTLLGVGQAQVRQPQAVQHVPATAVAAYALLLLAAVQAFGPTGQPQALPPPAWRRRETPPRAATMRLINHLRWELWAAVLEAGGFGGFWSATPVDEKPAEPQTPALHSVCYTQAG
jgi:hypothetical protein